MQEITVVGGGLAGLVAAIEAAERGAPVRLLEARSRLGGRAASTVATRVANLGPHALYTGGSLWDWLDARGLARPAPRPRPTRVRFRWQGEVRRTPPAGVLRVAKLLRAEAPVDTSFHDWIADRLGPELATPVANLAGNLTFDHDPGRLSAAFVWERMRRITFAPAPVARYVAGGWGALVDRLAARARALGVAVETGAKVASVDELDGPVIVAVEPGAARRLLGDDGLAPTTTRTALLDVALLAEGGDPYLVLDLDEGAFSTRVTHVLADLAPAGESLVQLSVGLRPDESLDSGVARLEAVLDAAQPGWRDRETWRRRAAVHESSGALDLPGTTWRDRPAVAHRPGLWLAGDWVAAPGHLAEVSCASAVQAAAAAAASIREPLPA